MRSAPRASRLRSPTGSAGSRWATSRPPTRSRSSSATPRTSTPAGSRVSSTWCVSPDRIPTCASARRCAGRSTCARSRRCSPSCVASPPTTTGSASMQHSPRCRGASGSVKGSGRDADSIVARAVAAGVRPTRRTADPRPGKSDRPERGGRPPRQQPATGDDADRLIDDARRRTTGRRQLAGVAGFAEVSPEVGVLDESALDSLLADDPDAALSLLAELVGATDAACGPGRGQLAARLGDRPGARSAARRGRDRTDRVRDGAGRPGDDLDLDRSMDVLTDAAARRSPARRRRAVVAGLGAPFHRVVPARRPQRFHARSTPRHRGTGRRSRGARAPIVTTTPCCRSPATSSPRRRSGSSAPSTTWSTGCSRSAGTAPPTSPRRSLPRPISSVVLRRRARSRSCSPTAAPPSPAT